MARLRGRAGQFAVRRRHPDHQGERRDAGGRLDLSRRRHRLQSAGRPRRDLHPGARQRPRRPRRGHRRQALGIAGDQGLPGARRELLGERRRQGPPAAAQHAEHAARLRRQHRPADCELRQGWRGRPARRPRPRSADRPATEPSARQDLRAPDHPRLGHQRRVRLGARRYPRLRRPYRRPRLVVPDDPAQGRVRRRDLAGRRARPRRRRQRLGRDVGGRPARHPLRADRQRQVQLLRRLPPRQQPVLGQPDRARGAHRQAALALPDRPPRHLGPRQQLGAAADDDHPRRPQGGRRRDGQQDGLPLRVRSRHRQADLADRGTSGAAEDDGPRSRTCHRRSRSRPSRSRSRGSRSRSPI